MNAIPSATLLHAIRTFLAPIWMGVHESDLVWHRASALPDVPSHAMCRHATAFLKRLLLDADRLAGRSPRSPDALCARWITVSGPLDVALLTKAPSYLLDDAEHYAMMDSQGRIVDVTADQFGLDPLVVAHWSSRFAEIPTPSDPGLASSARAWAKRRSYDDLVLQACRSF